MSQACAAWRGDIGAYIVGALSAEAGARVKQHLESCAACRSDYQDHAPVRDWLNSLGSPDGESGDVAPARPPLEPLRLSGIRARWRWLAGAGASAAAVAVIAISTTQPAAPVHRAFDRASGAHGQAQLHATPSGTQIDLTVTGLPADERCISW